MIKEMNDNKLSIIGPKLFSNGRYRMNVRTSEFCHMDYLEVEDTQTAENVTLEFSKNNKKLTGIWQKQQHLYSSGKEFSPETDSKEARWRQRSMVPISMEFHEIYFNEIGEATGNYHSSPDERDYHSFLNEQEFMAAAKICLESNDEAVLNNEERELKNFIMDYLDANIKAEKLPVPGAGSKKPDILKI